MSAVTASRVPELLSHHEPGEDADDPEQRDQQEQEDPLQRAAGRGEQFGQLDSCVHVPIVSER